MTPAFRLTSVKAAVAGVLDPLEPAAMPMRNGSGRAKRDSPATVHWLPSVEYEPTKRLTSGGPGCSIFSRRSQTGALMPGLIGDTVAMRLLLARLWNCTPIPAVRLRMTAGCVRENETGGPCRIISPTRAAGSAWAKVATLAVNTWLPPTLAKARTPDSINRDSGSPCPDTVRAPPLQIALAAHCRDLVEGPVARGRLAGQIRHPQGIDLGGGGRGAALRGHRQPDRHLGGKIEIGAAHLGPVEAGGGARGGDGATAAGEAQPLPGAHAGIVARTPWSRRRWSPAPAAGRLSPYRPGG